MGSSRDLHSYWDLYGSGNDDNLAAYGIATANAYFAADQKNFADFSWNHPVFGIKVNVYDYDEIGYEIYRSMLYSCIIS